MSDHIDRNAFIVLLILMAIFAVVIVVAVDSDNDFRERCEAVGGKPISTRGERLCMKKELFVEGMSDE